MKKLLKLVLILALVFPTIVLANNDLINEIKRQKEEDKKTIIACSLLGLYQSLGALAVIIVYNKKNSVK